MKKALLISFLTMVMTGIAVAMPGIDLNIPPVPTPLDSGGPDAFGYRWQDNDGGGGPTFNWIDITGYGTRVTGLGDDNNVGPFNMNFEFPYYWYMVNRMWIGSNGYISFSSNANFAHPFAGIPTPAAPNDLIAVLTGDLDFSRGNPLCYYYTNNADTFIVSWLNVGEFGYIDSLHNAQVIFSARDSSILFQYGENHGRFLDSNGETRTIIGIENVNGQVGIQYLHDNLPSNHMWHQGLALKFHPTPDPNFQVRDAGVLQGQNETSGAVFLPNNTAFTPRALFKNFGNQPANNIQVRCVIRRGTTQVYSQYDTIASLAPSEAVWLDFPTSYTPTTIFSYRVTFSTAMTPDDNPNNNTMTTELDTYVLPQVLRYCDDIPAAQGRAWTGDFSGFGVEYEVPQDLELDSAGFNVLSVTANGPAYIWVIPDSAGQPNLNNILAGDTVTVTTSGWYNIDFTWADLVFPANNKFYVVVLHAFENTFVFSMDDTAPLSNRGWEYTGGMAPDRERGTVDIMIQIKADTATVTSVDEGNVPKNFSLAQNYPNPFNARTIIGFSLKSDAEVKLGIYNIAGQLVETFSGHYLAGQNSIIWDASAAASGVYFYKLDVGGVTETRRMVLVK
jgi:hypothetical protein